MRCDKHFEVIASNPPYCVRSTLGELPAEVRREPRLALDGGDDGLDAYRALVAGATASLAAGGALVVEVGLGQAAPVVELFRGAGLVDVGAHRDLAGIERVVSGRAVGEGDAEDRHPRG